MYVSTISGSLVILTYYILLYLRFWPEWSTDANFARYTVVSAVTFVIAAIFTVLITYSAVMAALMPMKPDVGIEQPEDSIKRV